MFTDGMCDSEVKMYMIMTGIYLSFYRKYREIVKVTFVWYYVRL